MKKSHCPDHPILFPASTHPNLATQMPSLKKRCFRDKCLLIVTIISVFLMILADVAPVYAAETGAIKALVANQAAVTDQTAATDPAAVKSGAAIVADEGPVTWTVTFDSQGGSTIQDALVEDSAVLVQPADPTRDGYRFLGWYRDTEWSAVWHFQQDVVTGSMTLYARWLQNTVSGLAAKSGGYDSVKLSWTADGGADFYEIGRSESADGPFGIVADTLDESSWTDSGLTTGQTYYYQIRSYVLTNEQRVAESDFSSAVSARPKPAKPGDFQIESASYTQIRLKWTAVAGATGYQVYRSTAESGTYTLIKTLTATQYTNSSLTTGKRYYYKIRAYCQVDATQVTSSFTTILSAKPVPAAPATFTLAANGAAGIGLGWSSVSGASGYQVYRAGQEAGPFTRIATTTATQFDHIGLVDQVYYYYKVRAYRVVNSTRIYGKFTAIQHSSTDATDDPATTPDLSTYYEQQLADNASLAYYHDDRKDRYLNYKINHADRSIKTVITYVNIGLDYDFYSNIAAIDNPSAVSVLVNKYHQLSKSFVPELATISSKYASGTQKVTPATKKAFEKMAKAAAANGLKMKAISAYRSYSRQSTIYWSKADPDDPASIAKRDRSSARPGHSEHQSGRAIDVNSLNQSLANTAVYAWYKDNAHKYGFIIRYPKNKESVTGYKYEPWHLRYLGVTLATAVYNSGLTYDEYCARQTASD